MKTWILSNGIIENYEFYKEKMDQDDLIICADGGALHAQKMGITPHIIIGDLDSIEPECKEYMQSKNIEFIKFPIKKDETDTHLAVEYALQKGYKEIILIGSLGTRFDHSFSNVSLLKLMLDRGVRGYILNDHNEIYLLNHHILLNGNIGDILSLQPISEKVYGVTTKGLYYELENENMEFGTSLGISNKFVELEAEISIQKGLLMAIKSKD